MLDLISGAMYVEPLTVFRELIQNSSDAIDTRSRRSSRKEDVIVVTLDRPNRSISVQDTGPGLKQSLAPGVLTSIGDSSKRGTQSRGFRGVGRLAGLSYCKKLRFETKVANESKITVVEWDGVKFRSKIKDPNYKADLEQLVADITSVSKVASAPDQRSESFFCVTLEGVARLPLDRLLNEQVVQHYISQHCPVPFPPSFAQRDEIEKLLKEHAGYKTYRVLLNEGGIESEHQPTQVFRPFGATINGETIDDEVARTHLIETSGGVNVVWYIDRQLSGAIPKSEGIRGLRARQKNIQVGGERLFSTLFREERFNSWVCGEVHIGDKTILPNGRRDSFEPTPSLNDLETKLYELTQRLSKKCRDDSRIRNREQKLHNETASLTELVELLNSTTVPPSIRTIISISATEKLDRIEQDHLSSDLKVPPVRRRNVTRLRKSLIAMSTDTAHRKRNNGRRNSSSLDIVFEEIFQATPDKTKALKIIAASLEKIEKSSRP